MTVRKRASLAGRCGIPLERDRVYVGVDTALDGGALEPAAVRPVRIRWPDGRSWEIQSIYDRREFGRAAFGNLCVRWAVCVARRRRELFWEPGDFFVAKRSGLAERRAT